MYDISKLYYYEDLSIDCTFRNKINMYHVEMPKYFVYLLDRLVSCLPFGF